MLLSAKLIGPQMFVRFYTGMVLGTRGKQMQFEIVHSLFVLLSNVSRIVSSHIDDSRRALYYKHFKSSLIAEHYLNMDLSYMYKKKLPKFRFSSHCLMIEKGRHQILNVLYDFVSFACGEMHTSLKTSSTSFSSVPFMQE